MSALDFLITQIPVVVIGLLWLRSTIVDLREIGHAWERYDDAIVRLVRAKHQLSTCRCQTSRGRR